ncbi:hypothetical protein DFH06DRAFT_1483656 [Mycena polygramma]|nr:hypothetical protein DFH06DRAFT_1483656 [Mycena polygramma]
MLDALEQDRAHILILAAQILDLEMALTTLRTEKTQVQERLDSYRYPVLTLPNELLSEIFVQFLPAYPECPSFTGAFSPTLLTQICRQWREIALATPSLWRAIQLTLSDNELDMSTRQFEMSDVWLARSGCSALSFRIHEKGMQVETFRTLAPHYARVEYLDLRLCRSRSGIEGPMPLLRHLEVDLDYIPTSTSDPRDVFSCREAPLLRTVKLNDFAAFHVTVPWGQLTDLTLTTVYPTECEPVLRRVPDLVHCELWITYDPDYDGPSSEIPLLRLESLIMHNYEHEATTGFLHAFMTPALRRLQIPEPSLAPNPIDNLRAFISKSVCRLQELGVTGQLSVHKDLAEYRRAFPGIPKLSLHGWYPFGEDLQVEEVSEVFESDNLEIEDS